MGLFDFMKKSINSYQKDGTITYGKIDCKELSLSNDVADMLKQKYIAFDIETTGLYNEFDELIEFGAVKYKDGTIVDQIDFFCKPDKLLTPKIVNLTHITNEMVANGCSQKEAIIKIRK